MLILCRQKHNKLSDFIDCTGKLEVIKLGSFYLDVEEMLLIVEQQSKAIEPKVLAVLLYFIENNDRYISMAELHENLWQGRIVSDAAVRRIISKLRVLFNDDHKTPQYLKSLPKRGYKLICPLERNAITGKEVNLQNQNTVVHLKENNPLHENIDKKTTLVVQSAEPKLSKENSKLLLQVMFMVSFVLLSMFGYFSYDAHKANVKKLKDTSSDQAQVIPTPTGIKIGLAQSADKKYLAYSGEDREQGGYRIFLKRPNDKGFKAITAKINYPYDLAFSSDNKYLFYGNYIEGNSSLNAIKIDGENTGKIHQIAILVGGFNIIAGVFTAHNVNDIYFGGQKTAKDAGLIYRYNRLNNSVTEITAAAENNLYDVDGAISPDNNYLAVLRKYEFSAKNEIRVIDLKNKKILFRYAQDADIYKITWQSNNVFFLASDQKIKQINIKTQQIKDILQGQKNIDAFLLQGNNHSAVFQDSEHVLIFQSIKTPKPFVEHSLPFSHWLNKQYFNIENDIYAASFDNKSNSRLVLAKINKQTQLSQLNLNTRQLTHYIGLNHINVMDVSREGYLLLRTDEGFALFNRKSKKLDYITSADQFVGDASFSADQQSILFSTRDFHGWHIQSYNLKNKKAVLLFEDYRFIRPYGKNYIVADAEQNLFFYNKAKNNTVNLHHKISAEPNTRWTVVNDYIYWSTMNLVETQFHQLDISRLTAPKETIKTFDFNKVRADFSVNKAGTVVMYAQKQQSDNRLVVLSLNNDKN